MQKSHRAFIPEFLLYMQKRGGPPRDRDIRAWFKKHYNGIKGEYLTDVRNGRYAPEKYVTGIIEMLIRGRTTEEFIQSGLILRDYLRNRGITSDLDMHELDQILSVVCTPVTNQPPEPSQGDDNTIDYLSTGAPKILQVGLDYMLRQAVRS